MNGGLGGIDASVPDLWSQLGVVHPKEILRKHYDFKIFK